MTVDVDETRETIPPPDPARTPLGRKLLELRSRILGSGEPGLGWDEIEEEVAARRGGWRSDGRLYRSRRPAGWGPLNSPRGWPRPTHLAVRVS